MTDSSFVLKNQPALASNYDATTGIHTQKVELATSATIDIGDVTLLAGSAIIGKVGIDNATAGITPVVSSAAESGHVLKSSAGNLIGLDVTTGAVAGYVLIFNSTSVPSNGAVTPIKAYQVAANSSISLSWNPTPIYFSTGISVAFSTTGPFTLTLSATAFISGEVV